MSYRNLCNWRNGPTSFDISSWPTGRLFPTNLVKSIGKITVNAGERAKERHSRPTPQIGRRNHCKRKAKVPMGAAAAQNWVPTLNVRMF
jgi:hypothetical protein